MKQPKRSRSEILKIRYQIYRKLGYNSRTSSYLSHKKLDVSTLEISKRTGKVKQNAKTKNFIQVKMKEFKNRDIIDAHQAKIKKVNNDTIYSQHGLLTHDRRYKGETGTIVGIIKNENKLSNDQAYYFFYYMTKNNLNYETAKKELLSNREFEEYDKNKKARQNELKRQYVERQTSKKINRMVGGWTL